ncbi:MAG: T9SS type A sorting domain-containing protein [Candidatus Hydrothermales bacterium]
MRSKFLFLLAILFSGLYSSYTLGESKSQIFLRWGITLAFYADTIILRHIDSVTYEEGGSLRKLRFYVWTPYDKIPVKKFIINRISGTLPQRKYGWLIVDGLGAYRTASLDNTNVLAFSRPLEGDIVDISLSYRRTGGIYIPSPELIYALTSDGKIKIFSVTLDSLLRENFVFKDNINDTLPYNTLIDTLVKNPIKALSVSLIVGKVDTFVYVGTTEGVYFSKLDTINFIRRDTVVGRLEYYLKWNKLGDLTDSVKMLYATSSFILAVTPAGLFRWDGTSWTQINNYKVNSVKGNRVPGAKIYLATTSGAYYSVDNGLTFTPISAFQGKNVLAVTEKPTGSYPGLGTYFAVIKGKGVYDDQGNHLTKGLEIFEAYGSLNGFDIEPDVFNRLWYACEAGLFYLKDIGGGNYVWNFNPGIDEKYDPQSPEASKLIGVNVADEIVNAFVNSFKALFNDTLYIDIEEIKKMFRDYFGRDYPESYIHFVINPYLVTPPDPNASPPYKPSDIMPVTLFTLHDKHSEALQELKDAIYVKVGFEVLGKVGGFLSLSTIEKKFVFNYQFVNRGLFVLKPNEDKLVRKGLAALLVANYKSRTDSILYNNPLITGVPGLFDLSAYYDSTGTNVNMFNISKYHGLGEPEANEFSTARVFTLFEYIKERYGLAKIKEIFEDTSSTWKRFNPYITSWALANAIDRTFDNNRDYHFRLINPFPREEATVSERYGFIEQEPYSYIIYRHNPDAKKHILKLSVSDEASYYDRQGNWFTYMEVYDVRYKFVRDVHGNIRDTTIEVVRVLPVDSSKNIYSIELLDNQTVKRQKIVVVNKNPRRVYSTARGRDTEAPHPIMIVLQNPMVDNFVDVYVWSRRKIFKDAKEEGVILKITEGGKLVAKEENLTNLAAAAPIALYTTSKEIPRKSTIYTFTAYVEDTTGNGTEVVLSVPTYYVEGGGIYASSDGSVKVSFPNNVNNLFLTLSKFDREGTEFIVPGSNEGISDVFVIGNRGRKLSQTFIVEIKDPALTKEGSGVFRYDEELGWVPVEGFVDRSEGKFVFETNAFGIFQVRAGGTVKNQPVLKVDGLWRESKGKMLLYVPIKTDVTLSIYDLAGRKVFDVFNGEKESGIYEFELRFPSNGIYFIKADIKGFSMIRKKLIVLGSN